MRGEYTVIAAETTPEMAEELARPLRDAGFKVVGTAGSLDRAADMCLAMPVDAVAAGPAVYAREGTGFAARINAFTPLFKPATAAVTGVWPETAVRVEYGSFIRVQEVFDDNGFAQAVRIASALRSRPESVGRRDAACLLRELGVTEYTDGFDSLMYALLSERPWEMAKELYADLAERGNTGLSNAERSMRYAISVGRSKRGELWQLCAPGAKGNLRTVNALRDVLEGHVAGGANNLTMTEKNTGKS